MKSTTTTSAPLSHFLTQVETVYLQGRLNYRLLFGHPVRVVENDFVYGERTRKTSYFQPGEIFALDLWRRNEYGTSAWAVYVLQAAEPGEEAMPVPQVKPAVKVLLEAVGQTHAKQALRLLREIEERTDPATLPANRFLLTDFRLKAAAKSPTAGRM